VLAVAAEVAADAGIGIGGEWSGTKPVLGTAAGLATDRSSPTRKLSPVVIDAASEQRKLKEA
jgi:hypothetical protein